MPKFLYLTALILVWTVFMMKKNQNRQVIIIVVLRQECATSRYSSTHQESFTQHVYNQGAGGKLPSKNSMAQKIVMHDCHDIVRLLGAPLNNK